MEYLQFEHINNWFSILAIVIIVIVAPMLPKLWEAGQKRKRTNTAGGDSYVLLKRLELINFFFHSPEEIDTIIKLYGQYKALKFENKIPNEYIDKEYAKWAKNYLK